MSKLWESPVEAFVWGWDWQIRDAKKITIFKIDPSNLDYQKQELVKLRMKQVANLMNGLQENVIPDIPSVSHLVADAVSKVEEPTMTLKPKRRGNPWGRAGKPK